MGCTFEEEHELPDFYLYCVSREFHKDAMVKMGYDACVRIDDANCFFDELNADLSARCAVSADGNVVACIYKPRRRSFDPHDRDHPAVLKDPRHVYQTEVRDIWTPAKRPIEPLIIHVAGLAKWCSPHFP